MISRKSFTNDWVLVAARTRRVAQKDLAGHSIACSAAGEKVNEFNTIRVCSSHVLTSCVTHTLEASEREKAKIVQWPTFLAAYRTSSSCALSLSLSLIENAVRWKRRRVCLTELAGWSEEFFRYKKFRTRTTFQKDNLYFRNVTSV